MILWLLDPLTHLKLDRDSTLFLAYLYQKSGEQNYFTHEVRLRDDHAECDAFPMQIKCNENVFLSLGVASRGDPRPTRLADFKCIFNRLEPPVDDDYLLQAQILMQHPRVLNSPIAVQVYSEKLLPLHFGRAVPTSTNLAFAPHDGITKPLNSFGGTDVVKVAKGDAIKPGSLFQPFLPEIHEGERRYFVVAGEVFGEVLKTSASNDFRTNSAWGATKVNRPPDPKFVGICQPIAVELQKMGIEIAVIDFIGDSIVEINITCPSFWNFWFADASPSERSRMEAAWRRLVG